MLKFLPLKKKDELLSSCKAALIGCTECKKLLAEILIEILKPIQQKRKALLEDKGEILSILKKGADKAKEVASGTMREVREKIGFLK